MTSAPHLTSRRQLNRPRRRTDVVSGCLLLVASAAGVVGSFGPWARVHDLPEVNGTIGGTSDEAGGTITAVLLSVVLVIGAARVAGRARTALPTLLVIVAAVVAGVTAWFSGTDLAHGGGSVPPDLMDTEWGVWLVGIAAALVVVVALCDCTVARLRRDSTR